MFCLFSMLSFNCVYFTQSDVLIKIMIFLFLLCITKEIPATVYPKKKPYSMPKYMLVINMLFENLINIRTFIGCRLRWDKKGFMQRMRAGY